MRYNNDGKRFCSNCRLFNATEGGNWKVSLNGKHRRWMCGGCWSRRKGPTMDAQKNGEYDPVKL